MSASPAEPLPFSEDPPERGDQRAFDLICALARDPARVRTILACSSVPPGVTRVALHPYRESIGPAVVVDLEGRVERCVREEDVTTLFRLRREQFDALVPTVPPPRPLSLDEDPEAVIDLPWERGTRFWREDLVLCRKWAAVLAHDNVRRLVATNHRLVNVRVTQLPHWWEAKPLAYLAQKRRMWSLAHAAGTYALLSVSDWTPPLVMREPPLDVLLGHSTVHQGLVGPIVRSMWAVGRTGELVLTNLEERLAINDSESGLWTAALSLAAVAAVDEALEEHALLRLELLAGSVPEPARARLKRIFEGTVEGLEVVNGRPERLRYECRRLADPILEQTLPAGHPLRPKEPGTARDDLATAVFASLPAHLFDEELTHSLLRIFPIVLRAPAEHLFLPAEIGPLLTPPYSEHFGAQVAVSWVHGGGEIEPGTGRVPRT